MQKFPVFVLTSSPFLNMIMYTICLFATLATIGRIGGRCVPGPHSTAAYAPADPESVAHTRPFPNGGCLLQYATCRRSITQLDFSRPYTHQIGSIFKIEPIFSSLTFQFVLERFAEFPHFGVNHRPAIWLGTMLVVVILVIRLARIKDLQRYNFCYDGIGVQIGRFRH